MEVNRESGAQHSRLRLAECPNPFAEGQAGGDLSITDDGGPMGDLDFASQAII
jgi:hypothetical protein